MSYGATAYRKLGVETSIQDADPHKLVSMLMDGALDRIMRAKGYMAQLGKAESMAGKGEEIGKAISIIGGLQASLNHDGDNPVAGNLDALYDYMAERLFESSRDNDVEKLDEVAGLLREIREGWNGIRAQVESGQLSMPAMAG